MDKHRAKLWRTQLRLFKRHLKVLAKLGILDTWCAEEITRRPSHGGWDCPDWDHSAWQQVLYNDIVAGKCSELLARGFIRSYTVTWWNDPPRLSAGGTLLAADAIYNKYSRQLRVKFGVLNAVSTLSEREQGLSAAVPQGRSDDLPAATVWTLLEDVLHPGDGDASGDQDALGTADEQPSAAEQTC